MVSALTAELLDYFNACRKELGDGGAIAEAFRSFTSRMLFSIYSEITFPGLSIEVEGSEVHVAASKLSESWFAYETLLPIMSVLGFESDRPEKIKSFGNASSIQEAIVLHRNFAVAGTPFGKASMFDDDHITDGYLQVLIEKSIDSFHESIRSITSVAGAREKIQGYLIYLEENSIGVQKDLLLLSYNAITSSVSNATPFHIMSIAYAVRNQYVHAGEIPASGIKDLSVKAALLTACFTFVYQYALIVATQLINHSLESSV
jgi:hypothetical protein